MKAATRFFFSLRAAAIMLSFAATCSSSSSPAAAPFPDPEMLHYLDTLYDQAKQLGRPLLNGEMNLLPKNTQGFANSVRCFSDISASSVQDNSRVLQFNLSSMGMGNKIVAIDLVLKQTRGAPTLKTQLHEMWGEEADLNLKLLDSGEYNGQWHTLHVQSAVDSVDSTSGERNYRLLLSVSGGKDDDKMEEVLRRVKPMLLIYTNEVNMTYESVDTSTDRTTAASTRSKSSRQQHGGRGIRRRKSVGTAPNPASSGPVNSQPSLAEMKKLHCRRQTRTMTFEQLGWPGTQFVVLTPHSAVFSFCTGHCNQPIHPPSSGGSTFYSNHAKIISLGQPKLAGIAPCCVPMEISPIEVTYYSRFTRVIVMTSFPDVSSCGCL